MATRTVVCPECDAPLAPGRFACGACGALLATVASGSRSLFPAEASAAPPEAEESSAAPRHDMPVAHAPAAGQAASAEAASDPAPPAHDPGPLREEPPALPPGAMWATPAAAAVPTPAAAPTATPAAAPTATPAALSGATPAAWPTSAAPEPGAPSWPDHAAWPPAPSSNGAWDPAVPVVAAPPAVPADEFRNPAGAYLPPSAVLPPAEALPLPTAKTASPARPAQSSLAESVGSLTLPSDPAAAVISIGAGVSAIGFLLPWADVVLGSSGMGSFLDRWGLAGPGHLVVFAVLLGLAALAAFSHRLPRQARPGLPAVGLGFLLVGLAWPYLFGPFGATVGVYVITAGGVVLAIAGTIELLLRRHAGPVATV